MEIDVLIFGGGIAGLWLLDELHRSGFRVLLAEANDLGSGQTICSQGIIHGGIKYSLDGLRQPTGTTIRDMPAIWADALAGRAMPDLRTVRVLSDSCLLWRTSSLRSRAGMLGAKVALRTPVASLSEADRPAALADCPGEVLQVAELVLDVPSLLSVLRQQHAARILAIAEPEAAGDHRPDARGITLRGPANECQLQVTPRAIVLTAGAGNERLRARFGLAADSMQRRPLHMVLVRGRLPMLFGHCIDFNRTRVTVTSKPLDDGEVVWQVGGQLAEDAVAWERDELLERGRRELNNVLPAVNFEGALWSSYRVDRAEARQPDGRRPEDCGLCVDGNVFTAWPTKLAMAPRLAAMVLDRLWQLGIDPAGQPESAIVADWPVPRVANPPWETTQSWVTLN